MEQEKTSTTTAEITAKGRTTGAVRCMNCMERIRPPLGAKTFKCPHCSFEWRISWPLPKFPRIRGPVWDVNRRLTEEAMSKKRKGKK
jgi:DNA-directed RNA polymerase subunit RPC12/RpoP